jgi:cell division septation protein DedD
MTNMLSRILFLLLLATNIGIGAWLFVAPRPPVASHPAVEPGVAPLVLLSEREDEKASAASAELAAAPESSGDASRDRCVSIGPFPTQSDLRRAMNTLTPAVKRIQFREARTQQSRGWSVFLPAPASREEALGVARQLNARGVRDFYVVTAGAQQNTISLGLFKDRNNAERRRGEIAALGFVPAITERTEDLPVYWLDYAIAPDSTLDWRQKLPDMLDITERKANCF